MLTAPLPSSVSLLLLTGPGLLGSVSYPDWIRIQSGQWIRIRIRNPDPGGKKWPTTKEKTFGNFMFWSAGLSLLRAEGYSCSLDVLYGGLRISKLQFSI
jgi:hypothetical protein